MWVNNLEMGHEYVHYGTMGEDGRLIDGGVMSVDGRAMGVDGGVMGVDGGAMGVDGGAMGVDGRAMGVDDGAMGVDGGAMGVDGGAMGVDGKVMDVDGGAMGGLMIVMVYACIHYVFNIWLLSTSGATVKSLSSGTYLNISYD